MAYRILALDGGVATLTYLRALLEVETRLPFIKKTDAFAGASDGTLASMYLAKYIDDMSGEVLLTNAIALADAMVESLQPHLWNWLRFLSGTRALTSGAKTRALVSQPQYLGQTRLHELARQVSLVSYDIRNPSRVRVFHNYPTGPDDEDSGRDTTLVDIAFASGSFPVILPVSQGMVDGGLYANNPSAIGLAQAIRPDGRRLDDLRFWSVGYAGAQLGGRCVQSDLKTPITDWGWGQWLLNPTAPLLFFQALFNSSDRGSSWQCQHLLGQRFLRLGIHSRMGVITGIVPVLLDLAGTFIDHAEQVVERWVKGDPTLQPSLDETLRWVEHTWLADAPKP